MKYLSLLLITGLALPINFLIGQQVDYYDMGYKYGIMLIEKQLSEQSAYALGASIQAHENETAEEQHMDTRNGALIIDVVENSSIEDTGLKKGDVIVGFNGKFISKPADLHRMVLRSRSGSNNKVKVLRNGISKTINVVLKEIPDNPFDFHHKMTNEDFKYKYFKSEYHDFTNEQKQMYDNGFSRGLKKGVFSTTWSNYPEVYYFCIGCLTLVILGSIII